MCSFIHEVSPLEEEHAPQADDSVTGANIAHGCHAREAGKRATRCFQALRTHLRR
jgi:hypothetical protein